MVVKIGYAKANNQGVKIAKGKYLLFLNSDTLIKDKSIQKLLNFLKSNPRFGIVGPEQVDGKGKIRLTVSRASPILFLDYLLKRLLSFPFFKKGGVIKTKGINGAAMIIKKELLEKIGGFNEKNFLYGDEYELCSKIKKLGLEVGLLTDCVIIHYKGQGTKQILPFWRWIFR